MSTTYKINRKGEDYFVRALNELNAMAQFYDDYPKFSGQDIEVTEWAIDL